MSLTRSAGRAVYRAWIPMMSNWTDDNGDDCVSNATYLEWFEYAINAWLTDAGLLDPGRSASACLLAESGCRYFKPVSHSDRLEVGVYVAMIGTSSVRYALGIFEVGASGPAAVGHVVHVYVDPKTLHPMPLPDDWRIALGELLTFEVDPNRGP